MAGPSDVSDPRSIVTPEAFNLAPELLGRPLAPPRRRLAAVLVDLLLIAVLSRAGGLLLGVAATVFIFRIAAGGPVNQALRTAFRVAVGCLGLVVLTITGCSLFLVFGPDMDVATDALRSELGLPTAPGAAGATGGEAEGLELEDVFGGISEVRALRGATSRDEAATAAVSLARRLERAGAPRPEIRELLVELLRSGPFDGDPDAVARAALSALDSPAGGRAATADAAAATGGASDDEAAEAEGTAAPGVASLSLTELLSEYGDSLRRDEAAGVEPADPGSRTAALRRDLVTRLAGDTLRALEEELADETDDRRDAERRLEQVRQRIEEAEEGGGLLGWLEELVDDLGLAFGWGGLYMTIFLAWWNGQTPGKRLLGIRVVQLDDSPISWWEAFERSGGYAAGFATGLLGFAQVYWDPNRQAIHDKIAETVVVLEGGEPVPGPWSEPGPSEGADGSTRVGSPV